MATTSVAGASGVRAPASVPAKRFYAPELDLLRLFAFTMVYLRHVVTGFGIARQQQLATTVSHAVPAMQIPAAVSGGGHAWMLVQELAQSLDFGVCLFFFLSSYLISRLLLLEKEATGTVAVKDFYLRRGLRIWPLYVFFLLAMVVVSRFYPWLNITRARLIASLLFIANWPVVLHGWIGSPIEPLWSVSVEEQFYVLWPQFARFGKKGLLGVSGVFALLPVATIMWCGSRPHAENTSMWANSLVQCLFFAGGALTAALSGTEHRARGAVERALLFAGGWACWLTASAGCHVVRTISPGVPDLLLGYALVLAGTLLIFLSCAGWRPARMPKSLLYLGKITYGLYVFHFFCLEVAWRLSAWALASAGVTRPPLMVVTALTAGLAIAMTIACAMASYTLLEAPFLKLKKRFTIVPSRPI